MLSTYLFLIHIWICLNMATAMVHVRQYSFKHQSIEMIHPLLANTINPIFLYTSHPHCILSISPTLLHPTKTICLEISCNKRTYHKWIPNESNTKQETLIIALSVGFDVIQFGYNRINGYMHQLFITRMKTVKETMQTYHIFLKEVWTSETTCFNVQWFISHS